MHCLVFLFVFCIFAMGFVIPGYANSWQDFEEMGERITQEEFAVHLVKAMKLDGSLPVAPLASDCVSLLERLGISPMRGWDPKAYLTEEDYLVIVAKAYGKEGILYERALAVEQNNIDIINKKWQESYEKTGRWMPLEELSHDKNYFPEGPLKSPFGLEYEDKNGDHKVDVHFLPVIAFMKFREFISQ